MATRLKNVDLVARAIGGEVGYHGDKSGSWVVLENKTHSINICFDGKGDKFESILVSEKIWQVVDEKVIITI